MTEKEMDEGTIAMYALGMLSPEEEKAIEAAAVADPSVRARIDGAQGVLGSLAHRQAHMPPMDLKARVLGAVEEQRKEELASGRFPLLHEGSRITDFAAWLDRPDLVRPADAGEFHVLEIERTADRETVVIWLDTAHDEEVHVDVVERFLILEGTCEVYIGDKVIPLVPGDIITIPLYVPHSVRVTSAVRCKALVQRVAA